MVLHRCHADGRRAALARCLPSWQANPYGPPGAWSSAAARCASSTGPDYEDWSLPKGKLDGRETHEQAALREVHEETGLRCTLGAELSSQEYTDRQGRPKTVRWWAMSVSTDDGFKPCTRSTSGAGSRPSRPSGSSSTSTTASSSARRSRPWLRAEGARPGRPRRSRASAARAHPRRPRRRAGPGDDRARADHGVVADRHARAEDRAGAQPDVVADEIGSPSPTRSAARRVDRVRRGDELHAAGDLAGRADRDRRDVEHQAVVVEERAGADAHAGAVLEAEGRPDVHALADTPEQLPQQPVAQRPARRTRWRCSARGSPARARSRRRGRRRRRCRARRASIRYFISPMARIVPHPLSGRATASVPRRRSRRCRPGRSGRSRPAARRPAGTPRPVR